MSPSSVFNWASDIALTPEQIEYNPRGPRGPQNPELIARRQPASDISSGLKRNRLPDGVGNLSHCSTAIVQHIFGAIQEYAGFEEPRWLG